MDFVEFVPTQDEGAEMTSPPDLVEPEQETAAKPMASAPTGIMDRLSQSSWARSVALLAASAIGGGSLSLISGCSVRDETQIMRTIEKEVKFSTFAADARVSLETMPEQLASRETLKRAIDGLLLPLNSSITSIEESHSCSEATLKTIQQAVTLAQKDIATARGDKNLSDSQQKLVELNQSAAQISQLKTGDFAQNIDSPGYQKLSQLQGQLHDWSDVLARDIDMIKFGLHAREVATLANGLEGSSAQLKMLSESPQLGPDWFKSHPSELALVRAQLQLSLEQVTKASQSAGFSEISQDLGDAAKLLKDVLHATDSTHQQEFFVKTAGQSISAGQALLKEAAHLVDALKTDLNKELATTIGAQAPAGGAVAQGGQATSGQGGIVHHHHHNSPDFLTWYLLMNRGGGFHGSYVHVPNQHYGYSGSTRFRSSPEYNSFSNASHETHAVAGGKPGLTSHAAGGGGGRSVSSTSGSSHISSPSHSTHSSPSHFGGSGSGFGGGKSFTSGFGG